MFTEKNKPKKKPQKLMDIESDLLCWIINNNAMEKTNL